MATLVTGAAGFIGFHVSMRLLDEGASVLGVDVLRDDESAHLRASRLARLTSHINFSFERLDVGLSRALEEIAGNRPIERVIHLAARANARSSFTEPSAYVHDNLTAFAAVLEFCRNRAVEHLVFASSGSVYGGGDGRPATESAGTDRPRSFYAATKKANEVMAYSYADAYGLPCTALRLFNVYGPWSRPDCASAIFARAITSGAPVPVYGDGAMLRSFTFVEDVANAVMESLSHPPAGLDGAPFRVTNVAGEQASTVTQLLDELEHLLGRRAERHHLPVQPGEVRHSVGSSAVGAATPLADGLARFVEWFLEYGDDVGWETSQWIEEVQHG